MTGQARRTRAEIAEWVSVHLFHFGDLDGLLREAIAPTIADLTASGAVSGQFFLRYWEGGLHVRLRLRPTAPRRVPAIERAVRTTASRYFARHPSTAPIDQPTYRAHASTYAQAEGREGYDRRLRPGDAVEFIPYHREHHAYGDPACLDLVERHFIEASALALPAVVAALPTAQRAALGLAAVTSALAVAEPDLDAAAARFADTAAASGWRPTRPGGAGQPGADAYEQRREEVVRQTRQLWCAADAGGGTVARWRRSIQELRDDLSLLWATGRCAPTNPGSPLAYLAMAIPARQRTVPLILLRCAHLFCNRIGLDAGTEVGMSQFLALALTDLAEQRR